MEKTYKENIGMWAVSTDEAHILHRKGSAEYPEIRRATVVAPDAWEEISLADIPPYTEAEYKDYQRYRAECKQRAKDAALYRASRSSAQ